MSFAKLRKQVRRNKKFLPLLIMTLPGMAYLIINNYIPMYGITLAFREVDYSKGIFNGDWIGFENFRFLFQTKDAWLITKNTLLYNGAFILVNTIVALIVAIMLSEITSKGFLRFSQTVIILPYIISIIIVSYLVYAFFSVDTGFVNNTILPMFGMEKISWYNEPKYWPFILTFVNAWKNVGYLSVIYFASIIGIDKQFYEAAELDGASKWQQIRTITLPSITPTICMMVLLAVGRIFYSDFGLFYQVPMNSGPLVSATNVIDTYVYRGLMQLNDIGMSSAASAYQALVGCALVITANLVVRKISPENALL